MQKGTINVKTENIFPIIKKFLYSDHDIFLRELISNAVDATQKLKTLSSLGVYNSDLGDLTIEVLLDKEAKTITVADKGIGLTAEEIEKYINQIAFSSAEEFVKKYKGKSDADKNNLIGHFGLGFYSAFMVSSKVEIFSKTYRKGAGSKAVRWECDGSPEYLLDEADRKDRGTSIVLHIAKDSEEFLDEDRILSILRKFCKFLPIPIRFGTEKSYEKVEGEKDENGHDKYDTIEKPRIINNTNPAWTKKPVELTDDDYKHFYNELYPQNFEDPLFHIHLNVDYPFNLTGILYFPKVKKYMDVRRDKIQLYCNQVFVTDSVEGIVPDFLTLLHGVIDSPDIPLNVSRSYLQGDPNVKKISNHIMKKVADKLEDLFKNNREDFEKKWDDIKIFIQYGMISEPRFYERAEKFNLFKNTGNKYFTREEYIEKIKVAQTDKNEKLVFLYTTDVNEQHSFIQSANNRGYDVLVFDGMLDSHFINTLEQKFENCSFVRVDSDVTDNLIKKEDPMTSKLSEEEKNKLPTVFEKFLDKEKYSIKVESLSEKDSPAIITQPEFMRRFKDMSSVGGMSYGGSFPESYNFVINCNHPLIFELLNQSEEKQEKITRQIIDLAKLPQGLLKGQDLTDFMKRTTDLLT